MKQSYHFPLIVKSNGIGLFIYKTGPEDLVFIDVKGVQKQNVKPLHPHHFIAQNAVCNPNNDPEKDYYISSGLGEAPAKDWNINKSGALSYAEATARNMFGRNEDRGMVGRMVWGHSDFRDAMVVGRAGSNIKIGDAVIKGGEIHEVLLEAANVSDLQRENTRLTGELAKANAIIDEVHKALRTEKGGDVIAHAKVLRQMADALVKLWRGEK